MTALSKWRGAALTGAALLGTVALAVPFASTGAAAPASATNTNVTGGHAYVRVDGGTDPVISRCSTDNRPQNETSLAVDPTNGDYLAAGANDYCATPVAGDAWEGLYVSTDGGRSWALTLVPGYPGDTSAQGLASPLHGLVGATGDPWDAFDSHGNLFVMGNAFNRSSPQNASVWVATFHRKAAPAAGAFPYDYVGTTILAQGVPAAAGPFNDKVAMTVDNSGGPTDGYVYAAWSHFQGNGNVKIETAVSRDHGRTFSNPVIVSQTTGDNQFPDLTVTPSGQVFLVWRTFAGRVPKQDSAVYVTSTDGGATWSMPATITTFTPYDKSDVYGTPAAAQAASESGAPDSVEGEDAGNARDCGDAPYTCTSGYTFYRDDSQVRIASDASGVYVVFNELVNAHATGTSYSPGGASRVAMWRFDGRRWQSAGLADDYRQNGVSWGHQTFPTVAASNGTVTVGWIDSRVDSCFSQDRPAGNCADGSAPRRGSVTTFVQTWRAGAWGSSRQIAGTSWNPNWEQFGGRTVPFYGDYITVSSGGGSTYIDWTDNRDVAGARSDADEDADGNDVAGDPHVGGACTDYSSTCFDRTGGLDQNLYLAKV
ncbi:MAG TPA: hypothetical protein VHN98_11740 [Acidimicrobiales bacterium]|nr:hypothetical protein [Acidimicrobiales bacterium]